MDCECNDISMTMFPPVAKLLLNLLSALGSLKFLHHLFNHAVSSGTIFEVLLVYVHVAYHFHFWQMGKAGAIGGSHFINGAHVCFEIQELAGSVAIYPIT